MGRSTQPPVSDVIKKSILTTLGDIIQQGAGGYEKLDIGTSKQILRVDPVSGKLAYVNKGLFFDEDKIVGVPNVDAVWNDGVGGYLINYWDIGSYNIGDILLLQYHIAFDAGGFPLRLVSQVQNDGGVGQVNFNGHATVHRNQITWVDDHGANGLSNSCIMICTNAGQVMLSISGVPYGDMGWFDHDESSLIVIPLYKQ